MPIYQYKCESCGICFEKMQHFSDEPLKTCPECGASVHRLIQPVGIIFKGSGFYVTDHRSSSSTTSKTTHSGNGDKEKSATPPAAGAADSNASSKKEAEG